jgi:predicted phage-related endonuclease
MAKTAPISDAEYDEADDFLQRFGKLVEPVIAQLYEQETGHRLTTPGFTVSAEHPELIGSPDRLCLDERRGVELKTENQFMDEFGEPGSDQVPQHYLVQCAHYMMLTGAQVWDVACLHGGSRFCIYTIHRDLELERMLVDRLVQWWQQHIVATIPPTIDGGPAWRKYLHMRYPRNIRPIEDLAPGKASMINELAAIHEMQDVLKAQRQKLENELKAIIGDRDGVTSPYGRVTWRNDKDSEVTDYKAAFQLLRAQYDPVVADAIKQACTDTKTGVRRFLLRPSKETYEQRHNRAPLDLSRAVAEIPRRDQQSLAAPSECSAHGADSADRLPPKPADSEM